MDCSQGHTNSDDAKFCSECGEGFAARTGTAAPPVQGGQASIPPGARPQRVYVRPEQVVVLTTDTFPGREVEVIGSVSGVAQPNLMRGNARKLSRKAVDIATRELKKNAAAMGADAVIGVKQSSYAARSAIATFNTFVGVQMVGTAVRTRPVGSTGPFGRSPSASKPAKPTRAASSPAKPARLIFGLRRKTFIWICVIAGIGLLVLLGAIGGSGSGSSDTRPSTTYAQDLANFSSQAVPPAAPTDPASVLDAKLTDCHTLKTSSKVKLRSVEMTETPTAYVVTFHLDGSMRDIHNPELDVFLASTPGPVLGKDAFYNFAIAYTNGKLSDSFSESFGMEYPDGLTVHNQTFQYDDKGSTFRAVFRKDQAPKLGKDLYWRAVLSDENSDITDCPSGEHLLVPASRGVK